MTTAVAENEPVSTIELALSLLGWLISVLGK